MLSPSPAKPDQPPLKILLIAPSAYTLGGVQTWLDMLLTGLTRVGETVWLGLVEGDHHRASDYLVVHPWGSTIKIRNPTGSAAGRVEAIKQAVLQAPVDLVVSVNIGDCLEAMRQLKAARATSAKLVMTVHGIESDYLGDLMAYAPWLDGVVHTNRLTGAMIDSKVAIDATRNHYAPYGVALSAQQSRNTAGEMLTILWMGRIEQQQKRALELPGIARCLRTLGVSFELIIAGNGELESDLDHALRSLESGSGKGPCHRMLGHVDHGTLLHEVLPTADVLLVNSSWETGPITIWEAMAAGVPVVSARYLGSGLENSLDHEQNCLLFNVGELEQAARQLQRVQSDPGLAALLRNNACTLVGERYSTDASVAAWHGALLAIDKMSSAGVGDETALPEQPNKPASRLDWLLGESMAERVRRGLGRRFRHQGPGGEWPHARFELDAAERERFDLLARTLDDQYRVGD